MRALVVSNMRPDAAHPERGSFVRDQVAALRRLADVEVELFEFEPGPRALAAAALALRRRARANAGRGAFDVVHAHFGLSAWPSLAASAAVHALTLHGTDLEHPRTRLATLAAVPRIDLLAAVSVALAERLPRRTRRRALVLPAGVDVERFKPLSRERARSELGLELARPYVLFPADPARPSKRHDLALALARAAGVEMLTLRGVQPEQVPLWVNAANAVLVPSEREGFGLGVLEALACEVPVLATPVGVHAQALEGVPGTLCARFALGRWQAALEPHLATADPRVPGRTHAMRFSTDAMAERVARAWRSALERSPRRSG